MNLRIITPIIGLLFVAMWLIVSALGGGGNELGTVVKYLSIAVLVASIVKPRFGFWATIAAMGYIDFIKRLLVLGGQFNFGDVTILLAFPPLLCYCIFLGVIIKKTFARDFTKADWQLILLWFVLSMIMGIMSLRGLNNGALGFLQQAANFVGYIPLVFIVPYLFKSNVQMLRALKTMIWLFLPIPIYALYQRYMGFAGFELDYLATGYSLEGRILGGQDFRYFSTLNSSQNLAKFASMFAVVALLLTSKYQTQYEGFKGFNKVGRIFLYLLFAYAGIISGARTGVLMGVVAIPAYFILKSRFLTAASYISGLFLAVFIISISNYVVESKILNQWTVALTQIVPESWDLNLNLGTMTIRFIGFAQWSKVAFWQPLGHSFSNPEYELEFPHHDMFTGLMLKFGYVPLTIMLMIGGFLMLKFHKQIYQKGIYHNNLYLSLAMVVCVLFGCLSTSNLSTYPINLLLYAFIGFTIVSARSSIIERAELIAQQEQLKEAQTES